MIMTKPKRCTACRTDKKSKEWQINVEPVELYQYGPGEMWSTDLFQIPKGRGFQYFLIVVDRISGFIQCKKIPNMTAQTVTSYLREMACQMGLPNVVKSDGGPCYKSSIFRDFADKYRIRHILTSAHHHESNGQAER